MALVYCDVCNRKQYNFIGSCTGHSDFPVKGFKPRVSIDVIIPTFKVTHTPAGVMRLDPSYDRARIHKRLDRMERVANALVLDDIDLGPFATAATIGPGGMSCSFCGIEVTHLTATEGRRKPRKIIKDKLTEVDDQIIWDQTTIHVTDKVLACPGCVDQLDKVVFPAFD